VDRRADAERRGQAQELLAVGRVFAVTLRTSFSRNSSLLISAAVGTSER
jgi:hypothetical protein